MRKEIGPREGMLIRRPWTIQGIQDKQEYRTCLLSLEYLISWPGGRLRCLKQEPSKLVDHNYLPIGYQIYKRGVYPLGTGTIVTDKWNILVCDIENLWRRIGCPAYVPYMSHICPISLKRRDIYGAYTEQIRDIWTFGDDCPVAWKASFQAISRPEAGKKHAVRWAHPGGKVGLTYGKRLQEDY